MSLINTYKKYFKPLLSNLYIKIGIVINFTYLMSGIIIGLGSIATNFYYVDFPVFYTAGHIVLFDLENLYNISVYPNLYFRYLPVSAFFFSIYSFVPIEIAYIIYNIFKFVLNLVIISFIYYLYDHFYSQNGLNEEYLCKLLFAYLAFGSHLTEFFMGQSNIILAFLLLCSIYLFEKADHSNKTEISGFKRFFLNMCVGLCLGVAISIKLTLIFVVPFVFAYKIQKSHITVDLSRFIGFFIVCLLNVFIFLIHPGLLERFLIINMRGRLTYMEGSFGISISRMIINILALFQIFVPPSFITLILTVPLFIIIFYQYLKKYREQRILPEIFLMALFIPILAYIDIWPYQYIISFPFLIIFMLRLHDTINKREESNSQFFEKARNRLQSGKYIINGIDFYWWQLIPLYFVVVLSTPFFNVIYCFSSILLFILFYSFYRTERYFDF